MTEKYTKILLYGTGVVAYNYYINTTEIIVAKNMTDEKTHTLYVCHVNGLIMDFQYIKP